MCRGRSIAGCCAAGLVVGLFLALACPPANAQQDDKKTGKLLKQVERSVVEEKSEHDQLDAKATKLAKDLRNIQERLVEAAKQARQHEQEMSDLEVRLAKLEDLEAEKSKLLASRRADFAKVLYALERLARYPPEAMLAQPSSPADTVRTAILLRSLVPEIERRAAQVRYEIDSLARAREQAAQRRAELKAARKALSQETATLNDLMAKKRELKTVTEKQRKASEDRLATLRREAGNLRELVAKLDQDRRDGEARKAALAKQAEQQTALTGVPISDRRGRLPMPAIGAISGHFGDVNKNGVKLRGIRIATRDNATVIAPYEGTVVYAGEFRGYGQLLIIEHAGGYHTLLAGMARIDSEMGQHVLSGEPVGVMGQVESGHPVLYVELRRSGRPINPLPWLASSGTAPQG